MNLADNALTTLDYVKKYLQQTATVGTTKDDLLEFLINSASQTIENMCRRKFKKQALVEKYVGKGTELLYLNNYPVIGNPTYVKIDSVALTLDTDYSVYDAEGGVLYRESLWDVSYLSYGLSGLRVSKKQNIEVSYTAGYVLPKDATATIPRTLPYDLELACAIAVAFNYKADIAHFSTVFTEAGAAFRPIRIPPHAEMLIKQYKRRW
jgi:hypothetical protein